MKCKNCGSEVDGKICKRCGTAVEYEIVEQNSDTQSDEMLDDETNQTFFQKIMSNRIFMGCIVSTLLSFLMGYAGVGIVLLICSYFNSPWFLNLFKGTKRTTVKWIVVACTILVAVICASLYSAD